MIQEIKTYRTSNGRSFDTLEEAETHELGDALDKAIVSLAVDRRERNYGEFTLYSAMHDLAKKHPDIARKVLAVLTEADAT